MPQVVRDDSLAESFVLHFHEYPERKDSHPNAAVQSG